jgi:hypothetical protein
MFNLVFVSQQSRRKDMNSKMQFRFKIVAALTVIGFAFGLLVL